MAALIHSRGRSSSCAIYDLEKYLIFRAFIEESSEFSLLYIEIVKIM